MYENLNLCSKDYFRKIFSHYTLNASQTQLRDTLLSKNALSWKQCAQLFMALESLTGRQL